MNREILRNMDTVHIPIQRLMALLETFALKHAARMLPDLLETADSEAVTNRQFLLSVLEKEVKGRNERRRNRNYSAAHFPPNIRPLGEFNPDELESGITEAMVAAGLGLHAINSGYTVCFEKMVSLIKILDTAETERCVLHYAGLSGCSDH